MTSTETNGTRTGEVMQNHAYAGDSHWTSIATAMEHSVDDNYIAVSEMPDDDTGLSGQDSSRTGLLTLGAPHSLDSVMSMFPERDVVDRHLARYMNAKYFIFPIVHAAQFQREYERFWTAPDTVSIMWVAMLCSMLTISVWIGEMTGSLCDIEGNLYLRAAAQCLALGDCSKPAPYLIEALLIYGQARYTSTLDPAGDVWMLLGATVRQALRMGYHRDPSHFFRMTPFEGEMRRRTFALIRQLDVLTSFQLGLPTSIQSGQFDTATPSHIMDCDFDEDSLALPPPRPENEPTLILYMIVKTRFLSIMERITNQQSHLALMPREEVGALEMQVQDAYKSVAPPFQLKPLTQALADPPHVIMMRFNIRLNALKCLLILRRHYLVQKSPTTAGLVSCAEISVEILDHQATIHHESKPGGRLAAGGVMISSMSLSDFYLASMVLCLVLLKRSRDERVPSEDVMFATGLSSLQQAYSIFKKIRAVSKEARKICVALASFLGKIKSNKPPTSLTAQNQASESPAPGDTVEDHWVTDDAFISLLEDDNYMNIDWTALDQFPYDFSLNMTSEWPDK